MTDIPKRKNDEPIPHRYWWIFGTLAIVLLIGLRFPIRLRISHEWNLVFYFLIGVSCSLATVSFIKRFRWRHKVVIVMLTCIVLTGLNIKNMNGIYIPSFEASCTQEHSGIIAIYRCSFQHSCYAATADYVSLPILPIGIRISEYWSGLCILF